MTQNSQLPEDFGVVLLNMGGAATSADVQPFLEALFSDPAIIQLPLGFLYQKVFARMVSKRRAPKVAPHYEAIGGSPILAQTQEQAVALEALLGCPVEIAMRYSTPRADMAVQALKRRGVKQILALPLYPQYSRTTTASSLDDLRREATEQGLAMTEVHSYPTDPAFLHALKQRFDDAVNGVEDLSKTRVLMVAHSIPVKYLEQGDPYLSEVQQTAKAFQSMLPQTESVVLCFQSRVGPVTWQGPFIPDEIRRAAHEGIKTVVVVPISFVSEHLETLYELDIELAEEAGKAGISQFIRVKTVRDEPHFMEGLAKLVRMTMRENNE